MKAELFVACPGGSLEVGPLRELARFANQHHVEAIRITHRQGLALRFPKRKKIPDTLPEGIRPLSGAQKNIMSSAIFYHAKDSESWLSESRILEIVQALSQAPEGPHSSVAVLEKAKPFFSVQENQISFAASPLAEHWEVYWKWQERIESLPALAPSHLLPEIKDFLQSCLLSPDSGAGIQTQGLSSQLLASFSQGLLFWDFSSKNFLGKKGSASVRASEPSSLSFIEGFGENKEYYELGIFRRDHNFPPLFLDELGYLCRKSRIGRIYLSPMHSFFIKNIATELLPEWEALLNRHGINLRHNQVELSFRMDHPARKLYHYLAAKLQQKEGKSPGCIGISQDASPLFGDFCIRIRKRILWKEYELYKKKPALLEAASPYLCLGSFSNRRLLWQALFDESGQSNRAFLKPSKERESEAKKQSEKKAHGFRCKDCGFVYEKLYGDPLSEVSAGTSFAKLPQGYVCPVCGNPKEDFSPYSFFRVPVPEVLEY